MTKNKINFKVTPKRFWGMLLGNLILGFGIAIFKLSGLGNDPFTAMMMALASLTPLEYAALAALLNTFFFLLEFIFGKHFVGLGTVINWFFLAYFVTFFYMKLPLILAPPRGILSHALYLIVGVTVVSFGVSLYQASSSGVAPYDSISLIMAEHLPVPYFWCRLSNDVFCALICFLAGGLLGIGTLVCALFLGPFIHFFNQTITYKLMGYEKNTACEDN